jgi:hypothetical protein
LEVKLFLVFVCADDQSKAYQFQPDKQKNIPTTEQKLNKILHDIISILKILNALTIYQK